MTDTAKQMQTVAAANALHGEKTFRSIQYAVTGSPDADCVVGVLAVLAHESINLRAKSRLLEYLAIRFRDEADLLDRTYAQGLPGLGTAQQAMPPGYSQSILPYSVTSAGSLQDAVASKPPTQSMLASLAQGIGIK